MILGLALAAHEHLLPLVDDGLAAVSLDRAQVSDGLVRDFVSSTTGSPARWRWTT